MRIPESIVIFALMRRKLYIFPTFAAMLMVMFVTIVPHHHHQAMICLVHEVCEMDGCCDDEHTNHSDANHEEDESHCISHEKYFPSDDLRVDFTPFPVPAVKVPVQTCNFHFCPAATQEVLIVSISPPILSWRINC